MRIAIFGVGGAGGHFGARLAAAGHDEVIFIARGEHLRAMRESGLRLEMPDGAEIAVQAVHATDDPAQVGPVDAVIVGVKAWQLAEAAEAMKPLIGPETMVVPLQNGVEASDQLAEILGAEHVLAGLCLTISFVAGPGRIRTVGVTNAVKFGEVDSHPSERVERLRGAFERAGVDAEVPKDIQAALWDKFLFVVPLGGLGAVTRAPFGVMRSVPETRALLEQGMREVLSVARARGVALPDDIVERILRFVDGLAPAGTASLQRDIAAGRPAELEAWVGAVVRLGRAAGVPTPVHAFIYGSLLPQELRARGKVEFPA